MQLPQMKEPGSVKNAAGTDAAALPRSRRDGRIPRTGASRKEAVPLALLILLQIVLIGVLLHFKERLFMDEFFSYARANATLDQLPLNVVIREPAAYFREMLSAGRPFIYGEVVRKEASNVHPPLYYIVLHTVCSLFPGRFSMYFAGAVNMLFSALTLLVLNAILKSFPLPSRARFLILFACVISPGILMSSVFLRMYVMEGFFMASLSCLFLSGRKRDLRYYILLFLTVFGGIMTHYHFLFFLFFSSLAFLVILLMERRFREIGFHALTLAASAASSLLFFPAMINQILHSDRGTEAQAGIRNVSEYGSRIRFFRHLVQEDILGTYFLIFFLVILLAAAAVRLFEKIRQNDPGDPLPKPGTAVFVRKYLLLFIPPALTGILIALTTGIFSVRYFYPLYPFAILAVTILFRRLPEGSPRLSRAADWLLALFILFFTVRAAGAADYSNLYLGAGEKTASLSEYHDTSCVYLLDDPVQQEKVFGDYGELGCYRDFMLVDMKDTAALEKLFSGSESLIIVTEESLSEAQSGGNEEVRSLLRDLAFLHGSGDSLSMLDRYSADTLTFYYAGGGAP